MPDTLAPLATVTSLPDVARYSIRVALEDLAPLEVAFGEVFPKVVGQVSGKPDRFVMCLGPDEWQFTAPKDETAKLVQAIAVLPVGLPCSITDISARELCFLIEGPEAVTVLNSGCPRDLEAMPSPSATRSVLESTQITLVKWTPQNFHLEVWRSFSPHILSCLDQAMNDLF